MENTAIQPNNIQRLGQNIGEGIDGLKEGVVNAYSNAAQNASNLYANVAQNANNAYENVAERVVGLGENVTNTMNQFGDKSVVDASQSFLDSNSMIAKFVFLILVIVAFLLLFNLGVFLLGYFTQPASNPYLIRGTSNANINTIIPQDPKSSSSIPVLRSNNQSTGIEFTWSIWLNINSLAPTSFPNAWQHIFNKGDANWLTTSVDTPSNPMSGIASVNNAPGLYLNAKTNTLRIVMDTVSPNDLKQPSTMVDIPNVPIRMWFNCVIRMQNKVMDVYINGTVAKRVVFDNVPKQNYNDVLVCQNGGFNGSIADLRYFDRALGITDIYSLVTSGRNTNVASNSAKLDATNFPFYLSGLWYNYK